MNTIANDDQFLCELSTTCSECEDDDWDAIRLVTLLLAEDRPHLNLSSCLDNASESGDNVKLVQLLLGDKRINPAHDESSSLICAIENGRMKIASLLLLDNRVDLNAGDGLALDLAIETENNSIAKLLLADRRIDPTLNSNKALFGAIHDHNYEMVGILAQLESVALSVDWEEMLGCAEEIEDQKMIDLVRSMMRG